MIKKFFPRDSVIGVHDQHTTQHVLDYWRHLRVLWDLQGVVLDVLKELWNIRRHVRTLAEQKLIVRFQNRYPGKPVKVYSISLINIYIGIFI